MGATLWYVNIFVSDFERAVAFYRDRLGLPLAFRDDDFGYATFDAGAAGLALVRVEPGSDDASRLVGRHTGVALGVPEIHAAHAELVEKGVAFTMPPTPQPWGGVLATFEDSEGNVLYLDQRPEPGPSSST